MPHSKTIALAGNNGPLLSMLSMSVFFVGASEFMLSAMLDRSVAPSASIPARSPGWSPAMPLRMRSPRPSSDICQTASDGVDPC